MFYKTINQLYNKKIPALFNTSETVSNDFSSK